MKSLRWPSLIRGASTVSCFLLLMMGTWGGLRTDLPTSMSPLLFLAQCCAGIVFSITAILPIVLLAVTFFSRRFFCRFCCPMGCLYEMIERGSRKFGPHRREHLSFFGGGIGITLAVGALIGSLLGWGWATRWLMLDPMVLFGSLVPSQSLHWGVLVLLGGLAWLAPWFWCRACCPLGALQDLVFSGRKELFLCFDRAKRKTTAEKKKNESVRNSSALTLTRRPFIRGALSFLTAGVLFYPLGSLYSKKKYFLRPPGAREEPDFSIRCVSCGRCMSVCPTKHLIPIRNLPKSEKKEYNRAEESWEGLFDSTPTLERDQTFCDENCTACSQVCPTGAIRSFSPEDKKGIRMGVARLNLEYCQLSASHECNICVHECPYNAIGLVWSDDYYANVPIVDEERCTGCGRCVVFCPGYDPIERGNEKGIPIPKGFRIVPLEQRG